jgi:hypothetical protein
MDILSTSGPSGLARRQTLSVVPAFDEEAVLREFHQRLTAVLDGLPVDAEDLRERRQP